MVEENIKCTHGISLNDRCQFCISEQFEANAIEFCAGYSLPEDVTLGDLLAALDSLRHEAEMGVVYENGDDVASFAGDAQVLMDMADEARAILAKFQKMEG